MWLELHDALIDHVKIKRLSRAVTRPTVTVRGHLVTLWLNVLRHAPDGNLVDWTTADIADYAEWDGDAVAFVQALVDCRLLDKADDGHFEAHDWGEYAGQLKVAERKRKQREKKRTRTVTVTDESRDSHATSCDMAGPSRDATANVALTGPDQTRPDQTRHDQETPRSEDTGLGGERDRAAFAAVQRIEQRGFPSFGALYGKNGAAIQALMPITDAELDDAMRSPGKSWAYAAKVIQSARDARSTTPVVTKPDPALAERYARRKEWLAIGKRYSIPSTLLREQEDQLAALAPSPEKLEHACAAADEASTERCAMWGDVIAILRSETTLRAVGAAP